MQTHTFLSRKSNKLQPKELKTITLFIHYITYCIQYMQVLVGLLKTYVDEMTFFQLAWVY